MVELLDKFSSFFALLQVFRYTCAHNYLCTMNKLLLLSLIALTILATALLVKHNSRTSKANYKIGVVASLTGFASNWGEDELRAYELATNQLNSKGGINGRLVELVVEDGKSDNLATTSATKKLIDIDKVQALLGPTWGETFAGGLAYANDQRVVTISPSSALEVAEEEQSLPFIFSTYWPMTPEVTRLLEYLESQPQPKVSILSDSGSYNAKITELFLQESAKYRVTILDHETLTPGSADFRAALLKLSTNKPSFIFLEIEDISELGPLLKQARELGIQSRFISTTSAQNELLEKDFAQYLEGLTFTYPSIQKNSDYEKLEQAYQTKFGSKPTGPSFFNAYAAANMLFAALKSSTENHSPLSEELTKTQVFVPGMGDLQFTEFGQINLANFEIRQYQNGTPVRIN